MIHVFIHIYIYIYIIKRYVHINMYIYIHSTYVYIYKYVYICMFFVKEWDVDTAPMCQNLSRDRCCHVPVTSELDRGGAAWLWKCRVTDPLLPNSVGWSFCDWMKDRRERFCTRICSTKLYNPAAADLHQCLDMFGSDMALENWRNIILCQLKDNYCMRCSMRI